MLKLIIKIALNAFALLVVATLVPGFHIDNLWTAVVAAVVIGVVNTFIRPILQILFIPLSIITFGVTAFLINVVLLWGVSYVVPGFTIDSFFSAVIASVVLFLVSLFLHQLSKEKKEK